MPACSATFPGIAMDLPADTVWSASWPGADGVPLAVARDVTRERAVPGTWLSALAM